MLERKEPWTIILRDDWTVWKQQYRRNARDDFQERCCDISNPATTTTAISNSYTLSKAMLDKQQQYWPFGRIYTKAQTRNVCISYFSIDQYFLIAYFLCFNRTEIVPASHSSHPTKGTTHHVRKNKENKENTKPPQSFIKKPRACKSVYVCIQSDQFLTLIQANYQPLSAEAQTVFGWRTGHYWRGSR